MGLVLQNALPADSSARRLKRRCNMAGIVWATINPRCGAWISALQVSRLSSLPLR